MTKKIVIEKKIPLDEELIMNISKEFGDNKNVFIFLENNDDAVSIQECKETFFAINNIVKETKTYNFSPLEELFYIYDIVRDKVYKKESEEQKITTSRDLSKALLGDKIVCLGYAAIFDTILKKIGYKTDITLLYGTKIVMDMHEIEYI